MEKIKKSRAHLVLLDDINYDKMFMWYLQCQTYQDDVFCIINNNKYVGVITYLDVVFIVDIYELELMAYKNYNKVVKESIKDINTLLNTDCNWQNIEPIINVIYDEDEIDKLLKNYKIICNKLVENNINLIKVKMPSETQLTNKISRLLWLNSKSWYTDIAKRYVKPLLKLISNNSYDEQKKRSLNEKPKYEKEIFNNRIFIVGPCIVRGVNVPNDSVLCMLYDKLTQIGFNVTNIPIIVWRYEPDKIYELMKYNLTNKDIVLMIEEEKCFGEIGINDIDMSIIMNQYKGDKYLYYDYPMHLTVFGVELVVDEIIKKIIPILQETNNIEETILLQARNIAKHQEQTMLNSFINDIKKQLPRYDKQTIVGSIVMNANPFTKGHRHLVEVAAQQVELLIVFVVEEDAAFVPFKDRFDLVVKGTQDLDNVFVFPSGRFIASRDTFKSYFEKETIQDSIIDATKDITIFGEKVAKLLNITKRYVGEEPLDKVTYQYNEQLKQKLCQYNVELIEIPRAEIDNGIISASYVRKYLKEGKEKNIKKLVPYTTYQYLVNNKEFLFGREVCMNMLKEKIKDKGEEIQEIHNLSQIKKFIKENKKVIIYGMGIDGLLLIKELDWEDMKYIRFCDKLALSKNIEFLNSEVISPQNLVTDTYRNYKIVIATRDFYIEIYKYLRQMKVDKDRIIILE